MGGVDSYRKLEVKKADEYRQETAESERVKEWRDVRA